jgi:hypothetical protein
MTSLVIQTPVGLLARISAATSSAASTTGWSSTTRDTSPIGSGLGGVDDAAREHQLECPGGADQPGQEPADADVTARQADPHEGHAEARRRCREPNVARQCQGQPAPGRGPVDGSVEGAVQVGDELVAHRVQALGSVEGYEGNRRAG